MNSYPEAVAKIANDYLERVKSQLRLVPLREQNEFLAEIESHVYEAYQQTPGDDDIARILAVLRNLGEPAEVVYDRLPRTMARSGAKRNVPLYVIGGIFIALFGIPLGFGGLGVMIGILAALAGLVVAFCTTAGSIVLVGALFVLLGLSRMLFSPLFDWLVNIGAIHLTPGMWDFLDHLTHFEQGLLFVLFGSVWLASGFGMMWLGIRLFRGLRFVSAMLLDRVRRFGRRVRGKLSQPAAGVNPAASPKPAV